MLSFSIGSLSLSLTDTHTLPCFLPSVTQMDQQCRKRGKEGKEEKAQEKGKTCPTRAETHTGKHTQAFYTLSSRYTLNAAISFTKFLLSILQSTHNCNKTCNSPLPCD